MRQDHNVFVVESHTSSNSPSDVLKKIYTDEVNMRPSVQGVSFLQLEILGWSPSP